MEKMSDDRRRWESQLNYNDDNVDKKKRYVRRKYSSFKQFSSACTVYNEWQDRVENSEIKRKGQIVKFETMFSFVEYVLLKSYLSQFLKQYFI